MNTIGKYKIIKELGSGGFGAVYLCEDQLGQQVAIKIFQPKDDAVAGAATSATADAGEVLKQRFKEEAKILHQLSDNTYIVNFMYYDETEDGIPYYVMPFLDRSLVEEIGKDAFSVGAREDLDPELFPRKLPLTRALEVLEQTTKALRAVHRAGLVHRDIKPANILLDKTGQVQLCDFGIAKLPDVEHSQSGVGMGSRNYMSPEQRESAKHVNAASDIYSLGVIAYRIITGTLPVGHFDEPLVLSPAIGNPLNKLILKSLSFDVDKRPQDAQTFFSALKEASKESNTTEIEDEEGTGTWVDAGQSGLKDELKPLRDQIVQLLLEHAEIPEGEFSHLEAMAAIADLNLEGLKTLINQCENNNRAQIKPKQNLLKLINTKLASEQGMSETDREAIYKVGESIGWDENKLATIIDSKGGNVARSNKKKRGPNKPSPRKSQKHSITTPESREKQGSALKAFLAVVILITLSTGVWEYYSYKVIQAELLTSQKETKSMLLEKGSAFLGSLMKTANLGAIAFSTEAKVDIETYQQQYQTERKTLELLYLELEKRVASAPEYNTHFSDIEGKYKAYFSAADTIFSARLEAKSAKYGILSEADKLFNLADEVGAALIEIQYFMAPEKHYEQMELVSDSAGEADTEILPVFKSIKEIKHTTKLSQLDAGMEEFVSSLNKSKRSFDKAEKGFSAFDSDGLAPIAAKAYERLAQGLKVEPSLVSYKKKELQKEIEAKLHLGKVEVLISELSLSLRTLMNQVRGELNLTEQQTKLYLDQSAKVQLLEMGFWTALGFAANDSKALNRYKLRYEKLKNSQAKASYRNTVSNYKNYTDKLDAVFGAKSKSFVAEQQVSNELHRLFEPVGDLQSALFKMELYKAPKKYRSDMELVSGFAKSADDILEQMYNIASHVEAAKYIDDLDAEMDDLMLVAKDSKAWFEKGAEIFQPFDSNKLIVKIGNGYSTLEEIIAESPSLVDKKIEQLKFLNKAKKTLLTSNETMHELLVTQ